ncbi:hypothetical protein DPMN_177680 [Dreissena polymorpha]|uniref:YqaJ viral recombinase domain-containing protein n=1 Tax=Dreissena polymorpha TaxID=45954 RepID=A0A9D4EBJ8_DREPO|nr:hypothetical protein DPMN_177680 [Dreissena polymorpha]
MNLGDCMSKHWTKSKYAPVISSLKVATYDIDSSIEDALRLINEICSFCATFNGQEDMYEAKGVVDMEMQENFHQLKTNVPSNDSRHVKQKSEEWFEIRSKAKVTGSTCNTALGLGLLKQQQAHFDKVINQKESMVQFSDQQKSNMEYGSLHEIDGIATIIGHVLPAFFPKLQFYEEGCAKLVSKNNDSFLVASPDGSFRESAEMDPALMFENKCKVKSKYTTPVFYEILKYYIPQVLCQMAAYKYDNLLFSCWSQQSTTVFTV